MNVVVSVLCNAKALLERSRIFYGRYRSKISIRSRSKIFYERSRPPLEITMLAVVILHYQQPY